MADILWHTFPMKQLTVTLFLTLAVLLGGMGVSESADFTVCEIAFKNKEYSFAALECRDHAKKGHAKAQYMLGVMYSQGTGVPQDYKAAVRWWVSSAAQGDNDSKRELEELKSKMVDRCLFDEIEKVTGPETKKIVETHCQNIMEQKLLEWFLSNIH